MDRSDKQTENDQLIIDIITNLKNELNETNICNHRYVYYRNDGSVPLCEKSCNIIINIINSGIHFKKYYNIQLTELINKLITKIFSSMYNTRYKKKYTPIDNRACCIIMKQPILINAIKLILETYKLNVSSINHILSNNNTKNLIINMNNEFIDSLSTINLDDLDEYDLDENTLIFIINNIRITEKSISGCIENFPNYINIFLERDNTIDIKPYLGLLFKTTSKYSIDVVKKYREYIEINITCLEYACEYCNFNLIEYLLDMKVEPNNKCFNNIFSTDLDRNIDVEKKCLGLLLASGYIPTRENVIHCLKNGILIENIENYGIEIDNKISNLYIKYNLIPTTFKIKPDINILEEICKTGLLKDIRTTVQKYNFIPNEQCMINACCLGSSAMNTRINYLKSVGGVFTYNVLCAYLRGKYTHYSPQAIAHFDPEYKKMKRIIERYEKLYGELEKEETEQEKTQKETKDIKERIQKQVENVKKLKENKKEQAIKTISKDKEMKILNIVVPTNIRFPKRQRQKVNPPKHLVEYFKLDKNKKISFIDVRKYLLEHIRKNKWFGEKKTHLNPPDDFRKLLGIENKGYIDFNDLDKLVQLCY